MLFGRVGFDLGKNICDPAAWADEFPLKRADIDPLLEFAGLAAI